MTNPKIPSRSDNEILDGLLVTAAMIDAFESIGRIPPDWDPTTMAEARMRMTKAIIAAARPKQDELATHRHNLGALAARLGLPTTASWGEVGAVVAQIVARTH